MLYTFFKICNLPGTFANNNNKLLLKMLVGEMYTIVCQATMRCGIVNSSEVTECMNLNKNKCTLCNIICQEPCMKLVTHDKSTYNIPSTIAMHTKGNVPPSPRPPSDCGGVQILQVSMSVVLGSLI